MTGMDTEEEAARAAAWECTKEKIPGENWGFFYWNL